jgi:hypothetical protein
MQFIGIIKRVIPFFLTFAAGLFIASFFVSLSAPSFEGVRKNRSERWGKHSRLKAENERLRVENDRLKEELQALDQPTGIGHGTEAETECFLRAKQQRAVKEMKMKTVTIK